jgi:predicted nucleotidyltransferase
MIKQDRLNGLNNVIDRIKEVEQRLAKQLDKEKTDLMEIEKAWQDLHESIFQLKNLQYFLGLKK